MIYSSAVSTFSTPPSTTTNTNDRNTSTPGFNLSADMNLPYRRAIEPQFVPPTVSCSPSSSTHISNISTSTTSTVHHLGTACLGQLQVIFPSYYASI